MKDVNYSGLHNIGALSFKLGVNRSFVFGRKGHAKACPFFFLRYKIFDNKQHYGIIYTTY